MPDVMNVSAVGTLPVVMFTNESTGRRGCWVCESIDRQSRAVATLRAMPHVTDVLAMHAPCVSDE